MIPITDKQYAFILRLLATRAHGLPTLQEKPLKLRGGKADFVVQGLSISQASDFISWLKEMPELETAPKSDSVLTVTVDKVGIYKAGETLYRVRKAKKTGHLYAEPWNEKLQDFEYLSGAIFRVSPEQRLDAKEVAKLGLITGKCWVCFRTLDKPQSIADGIGPVCKKNYDKAEEVEEDDKGE